MVAVWSRNPLLIGIGGYPCLPPMFTHTDRRILDLERSWWLLPGPKDGAIGDVLGISAASYYQRLRELVADPEAHRYDPLTVRRVHRLIESGR